jgi:hypothetical protein
MPTIERPTQLRLWGFILTVGGGALIAVGALLPWVSVGLKSDTQGALTTTSPGVDLRPGQVCLALGVLAILAILALRVMHSISLRRAVSIGVLVAGLVAIVLGVRELTIKDHLLFTGARQIAEQIHAQTGLPPHDVLTKAHDELQKEGFADAGIGIWLTIAGGAVTIVGGVLDVLWVQSRARAHAHAFDAPSAAS